MIKELREIRKAICHLKWKEEDSDKVDELFEIELEVAHLIDIAVDKEYEILKKVLTAI